MMALTTKLQTCHLLAKGVFSVTCVFFNPPELSAWVIGSMFACGCWHRALVLDASPVTQLGGQRPPLK